MTALWMDNLALALPARSGILLYGNVHDVHVLLESSDEWRPAETIECVWSVLEPLAYEFILVYDPTGGLSIYPANRSDSVAGVLPTLSDSSSKLLSEGAVLTLHELQEFVQGILTGSAKRAAMLVQHASRLVRSPTDLEPDEHRFFTACEKAMLEATQHVLNDIPFFNPVIWLVQSERDLPGWLVVDREMVGSIAIPRPDHDSRLRTARELGPRLAHFEKTVVTDRDRIVEEFATLTEGMTLRSLITIATLARAEAMGFQDLPEAVRSYRVGVPDNPWNKHHVFQQVEKGDTHLRERVLGQEAAVEKTLDILKRGVTGLSGAQASSRSNRPRGVLFFAGPTGVGKTELAKAITQLLFGSEEAYLRFDMSEFSAEHAEARLIGAPPGYIGYEAGGQLTDAIRQRPFSVLLFDEIEKAHPRLMDKFLQILEDGRLTDGRGQTVYFSESVIIFTSNLGIITYDEAGRPRANVSAQENLPHPEVEARVRRAIEEHFRYRLGRPELLNRLGDNIVVFDFIKPEVGAKIFDKALVNVARRLAEEQGLTLRIPDELTAELREWCIADLENGGRGIGNRLETSFINPLARALFRLLATDGENTSLHIEAIELKSPRFTVSARLGD